MNATMRITDLRQVENPYKGGRMWWQVDIELMPSGKHLCPITAVSPRIVIEDLKECGYDVVAPRRVHDVIANWEANR